MNTFSTNKPSYAERLQDTIDKLRKENNELKNDIDDLRDDVRYLQNQLTN